MPLILQGAQRRYAWGSTTAIQNFCDLPINGEPLAEIWYGAHHSAPSSIRYPDQDRMPLDLFIERDPAAILGPAHSRFENKLPYLVKLLAPGQAVSLQVHPTELQAEIGYAREDEAGVPLDSPSRSFVDRNHKPEMVIALTAFEGLIGFRPTHEIADSLSHASRGSLLSELLGLLKRRRLADAFFAIMHAESSRLIELSTELIERRHEDPALRRLGDLSTTYTLEDPGLIASLFLNAVCLQPGEAIFVDAGVPHSYQSGLAAEVMANSDNVLRAGLTSKHINVPGLLSTVEFESRQPTVQTPREADGRFEIPVPDFATAYVQGECTFDRASPRIVLALASDVAVKVGADAVTLKRGEAAFIPALVKAVTVSDGPALVTTVGE